MAFTIRPATLEYGAYLPIISSFTVIEKACVELDH